MVILIAGSLVSSIEVSVSVPIAKSAYSKEELTEAKINGKSMKVLGILLITSGSITIFLAVRKMAAYSRVPNNRTCTIIFFFFAKKYRPIRPY